MRPLRVAAAVWRDRRGITSLEFAFAALPLFAMIFGTMSLGIYYFYESGIDLAVYSSARQIMTGQAQASNLLTSPAVFSTNVLCPNMPGYIACSTTNPTVAITVVTDPASNLQMNPVTQNGKTYTVSQMKKLPAAACSPGQGAIVYIQVTYTVPALNAVYAAFGNGKILSGTAFKVEEFPDAVLNGNPVNNCPVPPS